ncbi:hypothetical protein HHI36_017974, partial [Cryptolaemus montrouzieri]
MLSDEEAQEVSRMLHKDVKSSKWQPNASSSLLQDSMTNSMYESSGAISMNDSIGPSSLQDESLTDSTDHLNDYVVNRATEISDVSNHKDMESSRSQLYDSTSSIDISVQDEGINHSKFDVSCSESKQVDKHWL